MSSPIAKNKKTGFDKALIASHQTLSHRSRVRCLVDVFRKEISTIGLEGTIKLLDIGCGDMSLTRGLAEEITNLEPTCIDIYPPPQLSQQSSGQFWQHYQQFDGVTLPFEHHQFDIIIFSDVLHHVPAEQLTSLLKSAANAGRFLLIKDHFEYGFFSRHLLRAMDFVGNYGYGVSVPSSYFTPETFTAAIRQVGLVIDHLETGIRLYEHLPIVRSFLSPRWQFIARCISSTAD